MENKISFTINADREHPLVNAAIIIKNWNSNSIATLKLNGKSKQNKQGIYRDTNVFVTLVSLVGVYSSSE